MMKHSFSQWPGAWERHLIRRYNNSQFFGGAKLPSAEDVLEAQARDQQELAQFHRSLQSLIEKCTQLTNETSAEQIAALKKELDSCHDTAFGLGADLTEQKSALAALNDVITSAMRQASRGSNSESRYELIKSEAKRHTQLKRLEFPIVCDLLRSVSPIPQGELTAALLSESDKAYKAALELLSPSRRKYLASRIDTIIKSLESEEHRLSAKRKRELLTKILTELPITSGEAVSG